MADENEELRVEPPVAERPPRSVGFLISQLGFLSSRGFMEALEPVGIDPREFLLMRFVAAAEGQSQQALAERLSVPASRMVALVDRLEDAGLVERRPNPEDRRIRELHLTRKGRGVIERAGKIAIDHETQLCHDAPSDRAALSRSLPAARHDRPGSQASNDRHKARRHRW